MVSGPVFDVPTTTSGKDAPTEAPKTPERVDEQASKTDKEVPKRKSLPEHFERNT